MSGSDNLVYRVFRESGRIMKGCAKIDYVELFNRLVVFTSSLRAKYERYKMDNIPLYDESYATHLEQVRKLEESLLDEVENGELEMTYDSLLSTANRKVAWMPLIQAFYDVNDMDNNIERDGREIPEHIMVLGMFQMIWEGILNYLDEEDYLTKNQVVEYINKHTECSIQSPDNISNSPEYFHVRDDVKIGKEEIYDLDETKQTSRHGVKIATLRQPRVFLFAPDFSAIGVKYNPDNILDGNLMNRYHEETGTHPPISRFHGKIIERLHPNSTKIPPGAVPGGIEFTKVQVLEYLKRRPPYVEVELDDGRKFVYNISQLFLEKRRKRKPRPANNNPVADNNSPVEENNSPVEENNSPVAARTGNNRSKKSRRGATINRRNARSNSPVEENNTPVSTRNSVTTPIVVNKRTQNQRNSPVAANKRGRKTSRGGGITRKIRRK